MEESRNKVISSSRTSYYSYFAISIQQFFFFAPSDRYCIALCFSSSSKGTLLSSQDSLDSIIIDRSTG
jgi:hypothetical protein